MSTIIEEVKEFKGMSSNPFATDGCALSAHLQTDADMSMVYPSNSRELAANVFSGFPGTMRRAVNVSSSSGHPFTTAVLATNQMYFFNPNTVSSVGYATGESFPSNSMLFELENGLYFTTASNTFHRFDMTTNTTVSVTPIGLISTPTGTSFGTLLSSANYGVIAVNIKEGCQVFYIRPTSDGAVTGNTQMGNGFAVSTTCVSVTEINKYAVVCCRDTGGAVVFFWDPGIGQADFSVKSSGGDPLFIRNVNESLILCSLNYDANSVSLVFSLFDGKSYFDPIYTYKKFSPISKVVQIEDCSAVVDDGNIYFSGNFCGEKGLWKFDPTTQSLTIQSFTNNSNSSTFTTYNAVAVPTQWGLVAADADAYIYNVTNNNYNSVLPQYISRRFNGGNSKLMKKWLSFGLSTHSDFDEVGSVPSTRTILVEYRTDNESSWSTIGTFDATTSPFVEYTFENTGITITDYYTIQFRLTWSGLTYLDSFYVKHDVLPQIEI